MGPRRVFSIKCAVAAAAAFAASPLALAGEHGEIGVARTSANQLVAHMHFPQPRVLGRSIFPGFPGYATALIGFANVELNEPDEDLYTLSLGSSIRATLTGITGGAAVYNGAPIMHVGDSMDFGPPFFDYHPVFSIPSPSAIPGSVGTLRFVLHDDSGQYADSAEFSITMTPACPGDYNLTGSVEVQDIFAFLTGWFAGERAADADQSGGLSVADIFAFINGWFAPCPT